MTVRDRAAPAVPAIAPAPPGGDRGARRARAVRAGALLLWAAVLVVALALQLSPARDLVPPLLLVGCTAAAVLELWRMLRTLLAGRIGLDVLALAAIVATLAVREWWAAAVIVLMLLGGAALEDFAAGRARSRLRALLEGAPTAAHRRTGDVLEDVPVAAVQPGDVLQVLPGEVVPVDCVLQGSSAVLDLAQLTGESLPVEVGPGDLAPSGGVVLERPMLAVASATVADSRYQRIVQLVADASASRPAMVRLADRYAVPFTALAFLLAGLGWFLSGDPVRFAEVLVVATPCPLLLAAPVAFVGGIGTAARHGVVVRDGGALEVMSRLRTVAFDKTGTLTRGEPAVVAVLPAAGTEEELLRTAAAVEQFSVHVLAAAIVRSAADRGVPLDPAVRVEEVVGGGTCGTVDGREVLVGKRSYLERSGVAVTAADGGPVGSVVHVGVDGRYAGAIVLADAVRPEAAGTVDALRRLGVRHVLLVSGDQEAAAHAVASAVGIAEVHAGCLPEDKVGILRRLRDRPVAMVGDGVNDAPVLAAADVGIAMGTRGSGAASEAADVVLLVDDLARVGEAVRLGRRTVRIALQSILLGIVLSIGLMGFALTGLLPALAGAVVQEGVDLLTILLALRAARSATPPPGGAVAARA